MKAKIEIFQGNQIGGCITRISTPRASIVIDYGENLPGRENKPQKEFDWSKEHIDAVFFTHYHGDHIGRFADIPEQIDLYMGEVTYYVMLNALEYSTNPDAKTKKASLTKRHKSGHIKFIERNEPIRISEDLTVTGYGVDHSAYDAYMFLIEAAGTNILHTGDFRDHGHRGHVWKYGKNQNVLLDVIKYYVLDHGKRQVDVLILEGTMMGERSAEKHFSEKDLKRWAKEYFKDHRHVFLLISATNVDSLASFYQAARANHLPVYANKYQRAQFRVFRKAGQKYGTHMYDFYGVKQFPFLSEKPDADNSKSLDEINRMRENGFVAIVGQYAHYESVMDELADVNPELIYSMWDGYLDPKREAYSESLARMCGKYHALHKHTGGHAYPQLLAQVISAVNPTQTIWPIHTECADGFMALPISDELKGKVKMDEA